MRNVPALYLFVLLAISGCNKVLTKQAQGVPALGPSIDLLVPADARRVGASMPVEISVAIPQASEAGTQSQEACVALAAGPGTLRPVFPVACAKSPSAGADAGVSGGLLNPAWTCLGLKVANGTSTGATLAIYSPAGRDEIVTLVGGLYQDASCTGTPVASVAVVVDLVAAVADAGITSTGDSGARHDGSGDAESAPDGLGPDAGPTDAASDRPGDFHTDASGCLSGDGRGNDAGCGP